jgi:hypothetical protein
MYWTSPAPNDQFSQEVSIGLMRRFWGRRPRDSARISAMVMRMVMGVAVGAVMALRTTLGLPAAERIAEAALEWEGGAMLAYAKEMARSGAG